MAPVLTLGFNSEKKKVTERERREYSKSLDNAFVVLYSLITKRLHKGKFTAVQCKCMQWVKNNVFWGHYSIKHVNYAI